MVWLAKTWTIKFRSCVPIKGLLPDLEGGWVLKSTSRNKPIDWCAGKFITFWSKDNPGRCKVYVGWSEVVYFDGVNT